MVVVVLTACPVGLRGDLTKWLLEISSGVFVGHLSGRVRNKLWERVTGQVRSGRALMVYSARNEQHLAFKVHNAEWIPTDHEGLELIVRPNNESGAQPNVLKHGWSSASKYRKVRRASYKR